MSRTVIDIDDEALAEAAAELGTATKRDTVNTALREITARRKRLRALNELRAMAARGDIDLEMLRDKKKYR